MPTNRSAKLFSQAGTYNDCKVQVDFVNSETLTEDNVAEALKGMAGVMIGPGFGQRGIEGKFVAIKHTCTHNIPTFGICLGMQCIAIEFARNVLGYKDANSREMDEKHRTTSLTSWRNRKQSPIWVERCVWAPTNVR